MEPDPDRLCPGLSKNRKSAAELVAAGRTIIFPTDTIHGFVCSAFCADAILEIFRLKQKTTYSPLPCLIGALEQLELLAADVNSDQQMLIDKFWPGPLTLIFDARTDLPEMLTGKTGSVGVRLPDFDSAADLAKKAGPIAATSVNVSGCAPLCDPKQIQTQFPDIPFFNCEHFSPGKPSTVLDARTRPFKIIREGVLPRASIKRAAGTEVC